MGRRKSDPPPRVPCRSCGNAIDVDWSRCPYCATESPVRDRRTLWAVLAAGVLVALAAALAL